MMSQSGSPYATGTTLSPEDLPRIQSLMDRVEAYMADRQWHTIQEIQRECGGSENSCSARIRQMRSMGYTVDRAKVEGKRGLFKYRAIKSEATQERLFAR